MITTVLMICLCVFAVAATGLIVVALVVLGVLAKDVISDFRRKKQ